MALSNRPLVPGHGVGDNNRSEVVQVSAIFFFPSVVLLTISILFILLPPDHNGVLVVFPCSSSGILLLSNDLFAIELRRVSCLLSDPLVQGNKELSEPGIWLWSFVLFLHQVEDKCHKSRKSIRPVCASSREWHWTVLDVSWNGTNVPPGILGIPATLEPRLVTSFINVLKPICVREFSSSGLLKCSSQFWARRIPMDSDVSFSFVLIKTTHTSHDQFCDFKLEECSL